MIDTLFHYVSYLRFVAYAFGLYLSFRLFVAQTPSELESFGLGLFLLGIGLTLEGLIHPDEYTRSEIREFSNEKSAKRVILICVLVFCLPVLIGLFFLNIQLFFSSARADMIATFRDLAYGCIAFGIGGITCFKERYNRLKSFRKTNRT